MRVLVSCLQSLKGHPLPAYEFWRPYFVQGCQEAGIECVEVPDVDWAEGLVYPPGSELATWRARTWEIVLDFVRKEQVCRPIDFFLGYLYPKQVEVAAITHLQRMGIPCINFFCDNIREFRQVPVEYRPFALHWVPEFEALPMYRKAGLPHLHAPMPCWVPPALRTVPSCESEPPTFIGSADVLRRDLLGQAVQAGADIVVRGPGWMPESGSLAAEAASRSLVQMLANQITLVRAQGFRGLYCKLQDRLMPLNTLPIAEQWVKPFASLHEYIRITREALVTLGINRVPTARKSNRNPLTYSRLRDIEAPMLGACYLTEWTEGLDHLYNLGSEIESYRTPEEMCAKIDELKDDKVRRRRMRERAQRRALADHSVARSLGRICKRLGLRNGS